MDHFAFPLLIYEIEEKQFAENFDYQEKEINFYQ